VLLRIAGLQDTMRKTGNSLIMLPQDTNCHWKTCLLFDSRAAGIIHSLITLTDFEEETDQIATDYVTLI